MIESCVMRWNGNCLVAELAGEVDHHMAAALRTVLDEEIRTAADDRNPIHLIFDFRSVTFMDSSGIGVILGRYQTIRERGGQVFVTGCDPYVERILNMAGVFMITTYCASVNEAMMKCLGKAENYG
ncbi:MAG: anti-sigma factor antagonist [Firmicutes bacterium]|nr:anti-sigma factor antagonist [Bacillota bacterium]